MEACGIYLIIHSFIILNKWNTGTFAIAPSENLRSGDLKEKATQTNPWQFSRDKSTQAVYEQILHDTRIEVVDRIVQTGFFWSSY